MAKLARNRAHIRATRWRAMTAVCGARRAREREIQAGNDSLKAALGPKRRTFR
jgi:hypothetical protein